MKLFTIALFLFCIQLTAALISNSGAFKDDLPVDMDGLESANRTVRERYYEAEGGVDGDGEYEKAARTDFFSLAGRIFNVTKTLTDFGVPLGMAILFSLPIYLLWLVTIIQFLWRKSFTDFV